MHSEPAWMPCRGYQPVTEMIKWGSFTRYWRPHILPPLRKGCIVSRYIQSTLIAKHWGVYVGRGYVVHFYHNEKKSKLAEVVKSSVRSFLLGCPLYVEAYPDNRCHGRAICEFAEWLGKTRENG